MPDAASLALFAAAAVVLAVTPGPAVLYVVAQGAHAGIRAGLVSALGIATGNLVHVAAAVVGLGALIVSSATAYQAVKYAGAAYLVYIGIRRLLDRDDAGDATAVRQPLARLYRNGVVVNVLNPKTALFFIAFLPQFVDPGDGRVPLQLALLGLLWTGIALAGDSLYGVVAGAAAARVRRASRIQRWVSGSVFIGLGAATALSGGRKA